MCCLIQFSSILLRTFALRIFHQRYWSEKRQQKLTGQQHRCCIFQQGFKAAHLNEQLQTHLLDKNENIEKHSKKKKNFNVK
jgi:hypothetical protein